MLQWFLRFSEFPEFTEFNESSAPFRENSIVNTSIESSATHLLRQEESHWQSEKNAQCEWALTVDNLENSEF